MALPANATRGQVIAHWGFRVFAAAVCAFLVSPIITFLPLSFSSGTFFHYPLPGLSMRWYDDFFSSSLWLPSFRNTLVVGAFATLLATFLGVLAAFGLWRARFPGRGMVMGLLVSPMVVPTIIIAVSVYYAFAPFGLTNSFLGLILAHAAIGSPFVVITVLATLSSFDENYLRAAASLGAGVVTTFRKITLPLIMPGIVSGALFAMAVSFDDVIIALFLAGPAQRTLPRLMFTSSYDNNSLTVTAAAAILVVISVSLMVSVELLRRRSARLAKSRIHVA